MGDANVKTFKNELSKIASVKSVSISDYLPIGNTKRNGNTFFKEGREKLDPGVYGQFWQRSKEIGIRKVLGASVQGIPTLLSGDFVKLVLPAILIALPIAWSG